MAAAAGCRPKAREVAAEVPVAPVSHPVQRKVKDFVDFTGRTDAVQSVNIIPRVTGYLVPAQKPVKEGSAAKKEDQMPVKEGSAAKEEDQMPFKEGSEVKKGDLLFQIDPRPYQAQYDQAKSQVDLDEAALDLAKTTLARYRALAQTTPGAVSEQALDQYKAAVAEAQARVVAQTKSLDVYQLNKDFTRVVSPIDGQASRYFLTLGNLVNQDQTLLTTIVSLDPMYVYFDMDEATRLRIIDLIEQGKITAPADTRILLGLQNEEGYPHTARVDFTNNQINSTTGSITMRGVFANPKLIPKTQDPGAAGPKASSAGKASAAGVAGAGQSVRRFVPGMYVRVRLEIGEPHDALLIIDRAIQSDQGRKYVYVLDAQNKLQTRSINALALQEDGLRVVEGVSPDEGVKPDDWVVVGAIQQLRAQMEVKPDPRPMPTLAGLAEAAPPGVGQPKGTGKK